MIALLFATEQEAKPLLDLARAEPGSDPEFPLYRGSVSGLSFLVIVSGMGMPAAARACRALVARHRVDTLVNIGLCGAVNGSLRVGAILTVASALRLESDGAAAAPGSSSAPAHPAEPWPGLDAVRLGSVTTPVFDPARRAALATQCDIVDMEGAAIAETCAELGVRCLLIKGVSDDAGSNGRKVLQENLHSVSLALAEHFCRTAHRSLAGRGPSTSREALGPVNRPGPIANFLNFTKIEHTVFSLPLLFAGAWLGAGNRMPSITVLLLIVVVGTGARTFGMAMNRILDRDIDAQNPRTANRDLPAGRLSLAGGYAVALTGLSLYLLGCAGLGRLCLYLSPFPLLPLMTYALLKRFTPLCHFGIGLCLACAPLGAFVAAAGRLPLEPGILLLAGFTFLWMSGFDIIYALQDLVSDRALGIRSIPAALGARQAQAVAAACHALAAIVLGTLWFQGRYGSLSGFALLVATGAFALAYHPRIPLPVRFFPISAIAGIAGACTVLLGRLI